MLYNLLRILCVATCMLATSCSTNSNEILIGTMLAPAQGATQAQLSYEAAAELAVEDLNKQLASQNSSFTIKLVKGDLGANPDIALQNFKSLINQGVKLFVGPAESNNLIAMMTAANLNGAFVVSNASTSPTLAIPGDNVFRLVPNDTKQAEKLAKRISDDGFTKLLIIAREDLYGIDFRTQLEIAFESISDNNRVLAPERYDPTTTDYNQHVQEWLEDIVNTPIIPSETALVVVAFEEIVPMVLEMVDQNRTTFGGFRWYSGDGIAQIDDVINNTSAASFLFNPTGLGGQGLIATSPAVALEDQSKLDAFDARLNESFPGTESIFAALAYDAVTLLAKTEIDMRAKGLTGVTAFKANLQTIASQTNGVTGNLAFNSAGDRATLPFGAWGLSQAGPGYQWIFNGLLP